MQTMSSFKITRREWRNTDTVIVPAETKENKAAKSYHRILYFIVVHIVQLFLERNDEMFVCFEIV